MHKETYELKKIAEDFIVKENSTEKIQKELKEKGEYKVFRLRKKHYTTENAVQQIAKALRLPRKNIGYAGSKDSKAITTQLISIRAAPKENILALHLNDLELEYLGAMEDPICLGDLEGNSFEITIRNLSESKEDAPRKITMFINYFGEQRFSKNNAAIGKAIIKKEFKRATELIIESSADDAKKLEEHLSKSRNDYVGALKTLPFKTLTLFIHAYQSKLWNEAAKALIEGNPGRENELIPLIGFGTEFMSKETEETYKQILEKEGVSQSDFVIRAIPDLTSNGSDHTLYAEIKNLKIQEMEEDELNPGRNKCKVTFSLAKGCYATEAIKAMMVQDAPQ
ncbi:tRNA pseudouridine(13) synthase TruD [Candidatus Woesearchaeota archaeon]|nr:tRNA pseudouridine(13) synthase TruD [Candidatus Woesearchaeota archaeon]